MEISHPFCGHVALLCRADEPTDAMGRGAQSSFAAGDFDVYLLAQSWSPHFCCHNTDRCSTVPWAFSARHLSLHGLWPGFMSAREGQTYPQSCETAKKLLATFLPSAYIDVAPSFTSYDAVARKATVGDLAKHEWKKHGTCTGLSPESYFNEALRAMNALPGDRGTPKVLSDRVGGEVSSAELRSSYAKRVAIHADKLCRLTEVTSCWAKAPDGTVGKQVDCPEHVMKGRDRPNCATFRITQLGQCMAGDGQKRKR